jgi:hypothetical protein
MTAKKKLKLKLMKTELQLINTIQLLNITIQPV